MLFTYFRNRAFFACVIRLDLVEFCHVYLLLAKVHAFSCLQLDYLYTFDLFTDGADFAGADAIEDE